MSLVFAGLVSLIAVRYPWVPEIGVLVALPVVVTVVSRREPALDGFMLTYRGGVGRLVLPVLACTWLFALAFMVLPDIGETHTSPRGVLALTFTTIVAGAVMLAWVGRRAPLPPPILRGYVVWFRVAVVLLLGMLAVSTSEGRLARVAAGALLTAFGEELFFRGYVQGGLDAAFGRGWTWFRIRVGPGLPISALMFGAFHLLPSLVAGGAVPWGWALWTVVFGLLAGALRNHTGSITLPWVMHATLLALRALGAR